jgi:hypothetical protein
MKKIILLLTMFSIGVSYGQNSEITPNNSWLKLGLNVAAPVGDIADFSPFMLGIDLRGQFLTNPHFALGIASGYNNYFGKDDYSDFGLIPLAAFGRYYFNESGWFVGLDLGYGFLTNVENTDGGLYLNPHFGYNTYDWNFYLFYQYTDTGLETDIQSVGLGITYNIRFR